MLAKFLHKAREPPDDWGNIQGNRKHPEIYPCRRYYGSDRFFDAVILAAMATVGAQSVGSMRRLIDNALEEKLIARAISPVDGGWDISLTAAGQQRWFQSPDRQRRRKPIPSSDGRNLAGLTLYRTMLGGVF